MGRKHKNDWDWIFETVGSIFSLLWDLFFCLLKVVPDLLTALLPKGQGQRAAPPRRVQDSGQDAKAVPPSRAQKPAPQPAQNTPRGRAAPQGASPKEAQSAQRPAAKKKAPKPVKVKKPASARWKLVGMVFLMLGLVVLADGVGDHDLENVVTGLLFGGTGGGLMVYGGVRDRQRKRFVQYLAVMGERESMPAEELARTLGLPRRRVLRDLQKMIDLGYFGRQAYLNMERGCLLRGGQIASVPPAEPPVPRPKETAAPVSAPREAEDGYSGILRSIRRANDRIADPALSSKINRLEALTAKIFQAVEADPKKKPRIDTILNYYLPTTQKLLNSYAQFEAAGVEGENLRQAKERIQTTMDAIIKGFEHQLDQLYQADVLDVDADIRVMEAMLRRDTGGAAADFGLESEDRPQPLV